MKRIFCGLVCTLMLIASTAFAAIVDDIAAIADNFFAGKVSGPDTLAKLAEEGENNENAPDIRGLAYINRAQVHKGMGNLALAKEDAQKAISINNNTVGGYDVLSRIQANAHEFDSAIKSIDTALKNLGKPDKEMEALRDNFVFLANAHDAVALHKEFQDNLFAAEAKYKGKPIWLKGKLSGIGRTISNNPELTIDAGMLKQFDCELFPNMAPLVGKLKKGDDVYLVCDLKQGGEAIVRLTRCELPNF